MNGLGLVKGLALTFKHFFSTYVADIFGGTANGMITGVSITPQPWRKARKPLDGRRNGKGKPPVSAAFPLQA